jgi:hypothetical protein
MKGTNKHERNNWSYTKCIWEVKSENTKQKGGGKEEERRKALNSEENMELRHNDYGYKTFSMEVK